MSAPHNSSELPVRSGAAVADNARAEVPSKRLRIPPELLPAIVDRWKDGEEIPDIAKELGVSKQALYQRIQTFLLASPRESYRDIKRQAHASRIAEFDKMILTARNKLDLARAVALSKNARWDAERKCPEDFGIKTEHRNENINVSVNREKVLEINPVDKASSCDSFSADAEKPHE